MAFRETFVIRRTWLILTLLVLSAPAHATCYTVYSGPTLVYQSTRAPVDLSYPLHETLPKRFGAGASMIFVPDNDSCGALDNEINSLVRFPLANAAVAAQAGGRGTIELQVPRRTGN